jgi:hypothetical protein
MTDSRVEEVLRDHGAMERERAFHESTWNDLARRLHPMQEMFTTPKPQQSPEVYDAPRGPLNRFSASLNGLLTPYGQKWHSLRMRGLKPGTPLAAYMDQKRDDLFEERYGAHTGFASQNVEVFRSVGWCGNGVLFVDDVPGGEGWGLAYKSVPMRQLYLAENARGKIDRVHRMLDYNGWQALGFFGDRLPQRIKDIAAKDPNQRFKFLHVVRKNEERVPGRADYRGMRFWACYVAMETREIIEEGGYRTMPYCVARYVTTAGEVYGRGPAHEVHPSIRMANVIKRDLVIVANRQAKPPLGTANEDIRVDLRPDAINPGTIDPASGKPLVLPIGLAEQLQVPMELLQQEQAIQREAFLDNLWQILQEKPNATATEVLERAQEKGILLSPTAGIMQGDYLGDVIDRELDILSSKGFFGDAPREMYQAGGDVTPEYDNPLSRALKAGDGVAVMRWLEAMGSIVQFDPAARHLINGVRAGKRVAQAYGTPSDCQNSEDEMKALQDQELAQQQLASIAQAAGPASQAALNLSKLQQTGGQAVQ